MTDEVVRRLYKHPTLKNGTISVGEESLPVVEGIVKLPETLGAELRWPLASREEVNAAKSAHDDKKAKAKPKRR